jgi:hypothetical protein
MVLLENEYTLGANASPFSPPGQFRLITLCTGHTITGKWYNLAPGKRALV